MKHLFTLLAVLFSLIAGGNLRAQNTIEFLGIPVDGNKSDVLSALEDKGFVPSYDNQRLGELNKIIDNKIATIYKSRS
ncbi:hypothetical protein [Paraprevotella clara]|uniref:hypothetical protein n=1 Tax=Paraprevotella clara TaxID=454154 RepID=UPI002FD8C6CF